MSKWHGIFAYYGRISSVEVMLDRCITTEIRVRGVDYSAGSLFFFRDICLTKDGSQSVCARSPCLAFSVEGVRKSELIAGDRDATGVRDTLLGTKRMNGEEASSRRTHTRWDGALDSSPLHHFKVKRRTHEQGSYTCWPMDVQDFKLMISVYTWGYLKWHTWKRPIVW